MEVLNYSQNMRKNHTTNNMAKLLQINVCYGHYSTGRIVENISDVVKSHGWDSYVAFRADVPSKNTANLIPIGNKWSKYFHYIKSLLFDKHGQGSTNATLNLINKIKEINPDIIHLHNIHGYYIDIRVLFKYLRKANLPVVITVHDCWLFTGHCSHFTKISCDKWKTGCNNCRLISSYPKSIKDNSSYNYQLKLNLFSNIKDLHLVTVSEWLADLVKESFLGNNDIRVIHNGIDTNVFRILNNRPNIPNIDNQCKIVLGVSSAWYDDKGLKDYIALSQILPSDIKICLVGINHKHKLPSNIICIPRTTNQNELVNIYNRADIVLSLSKSETFGLTIVEGYACGTPAIVYDNTALPELITPTTGLKVPNGDINAVKNAIIEILNEGKREYSKACRQLAVSAYNNVNCFAKYYQLYNEILTNRDI